MSGCKYESFSSRNTCIFVHDISKSNPRVGANLNAMHETSPFSSGSDGREFFRPELLSLLFTLKAKVQQSLSCCMMSPREHVMSWTHFPHHCSFATGIHRSPVASPHKDQGVVSLRFRELSKIMSRKYTMPEITFMVRILC